MDIFLWYVIIVSLISMLVCCWDKISAIKHKRRVREAVLLWLGILGGSLVMYLTMRIIRHKTRHNRFMVGLPLIFLFQTAIMLLIYFRIF